MDENIELGNIVDPPPEQELEDDDNYEQADIYDSEPINEEADISDAPIDEDDNPTGGDAPSSERYHTPTGGDDSIYDWDPLDDGDNTILLTNEERIDVLNTIEFLDNVVVDCPEEYKNPNFIKYLIRKHRFDITKTYSNEGNNVDYEINYYGKPYLDEDNSKIRPAREYSTDGGEFSSDAEFQQFRTDIDYLYDQWKSEVRKRQIKRAGIVGGVLIGISSLITGLALGLKRTGHSIVHDSKMKWKKLTPAEKKQIVIPWTELEKASGKGAIIVGDYIYIIIGGTILVYALSK